MASLNLVPSTWHSYIFNAAGFLSLLPIAIGTNAIVNPPGALAAFKFPSPKGDKDRQLALGLIRIYGGRNLGLGLIGAAAWYFGARQTLGVELLSLSIMAFNDAFVCKQVLDDAWLQHVAFVPVFVGLGLPLVGLL